MARVIAEHPDSRRIAVEESDLYEVGANPLNQAANILRDTGERFTRPARPADDCVSLFDEGFVVVADINEDGHEVPRNPDLYRGVGIAEASTPSDLGRRVAEAERSAE